MVARLMDRHKSITFPLQDLRSPEMAAAYENHKKTKEFTAKCPLCQKKSIKNFEHWRIVDNAFPYDLIAVTHHLLIPKEHATEKDLTKEALDELILIKTQKLFIYDFILMALPKSVSIPQHLHYHLIVQSAC